MAEVSNDHTEWKADVAFQELHKEQQIHEAQQVCPLPTAIIRALNLAQIFVHIIHWGNVGYQIMGMLAATAQRGVPIRVISGSAPTNGTPAYERESQHNQYFGTHYRRVSGPAKYGEQPNLKFFVIDGLLAFYGSANLTDQGIFGTLPEQKTNDLDIWTDLNKIQEKHNEYFSHWWPQTEPNHEYTFAGDLGGWH